MGTREKLIAIFQEKPGKLVSGEELSNQLGVSRTSIWKHLSKLREMGYQVEAIPSQGYRLIGAPDLLLPESISNGLSTTLIGKEIKHFSTLESTNLTASQLGEQGAAEGLVCIAEEQTSGKGRLGRYWISPTGINLYMSILLRPQLPPYDAPKLTFLSVVALAETFKEVCNLKVEAKWPNDLLCNGKKIAGLLNEMSAEADRLNQVIMGIGVNLNMTAEQFPTHLRTPPTSAMLETGVKIDRIAFTRTLLERLDSWYQTFLQEGFTPVRSAWESISNTIGRKVAIDSGDQHLVGRVTGLDNMGALLVQIGDSVQTIYAGDVTLIED